MIVRYLPLLAASLRRKRLRTFFTIASIVVAFLLFGLAESLRYSLQSGVDVAGADRLLTMHKVSFTQLLPQSYENRIRAIDGVVEVSPQTWFGAWFRDERNQIPTFPAKPEAFLRIYPEWDLPDDQRTAWVGDRAGILIGRGLADITGWKVGEAVPLRSSIWKGSTSQVLRTTTREASTSMAPVAMSLFTMAPGRGLTRPATATQVSWRSSAAAVPRSA